MDANGTRERSDSDGMSAMVCDPRSNPRFVPQEALQVQFSLNNYALFNAHH
jgi:hypothetical protein